MNDIEAKVSFLAHYVELVARASVVIKDDHSARVFGRALFLALDSFLKFAPALKNALRSAGKLSPAEADTLKHRIEKLRSDYEGYYATLRDKLGAHQQEVSLDALVEVWNEIDTTTLTIFADEVKGIFAAVNAAGLTSAFPRPSELDDEGFFDRFADNAARHATPQVGVDRVALARPQTLSMIAAHPTQEKCQRLVAAFDNLRVLVGELQKPCEPSLLARKVILDLVLVDLCSIIDNLFTDRAADKNSPADPSLVTLWKADGFAGVPLLAAFTRDAALELQVREVRNKGAAHIDSALSLSDILDLFKKLPMDRLSAYPNELYLLFRQACFQDIRSKIFLIQGAAVQGAVSVHETDAIRPFSS